MKQTKANITSWKIAIPPILSRNRVFNIKPIAIGTPLRESLGSYTSRIADAHHVSLFTLTNEAVVPMLKSDRLNHMINKGVTGFYETTRSLNGMENKAVYLAFALEKLAGQSNLLALTMYPWRILMPSINLLKRHRTWCSKCFREWRLNGKEIYEPLIWSVDSVKMCDIHRQLLDSKCPYCSKRVRLTNFRVRPGTCSNCGRFLDRACGDTLTKSLSVENCIRFRWYWRSVASMLARSQKLIEKNINCSISSGQSTPVSTIGVHNAFVKCIDKYYAGDIDRFAVGVKTTRNVAWLWHLGYSLPPFETILNLCGQYSLDIVSFITEGKLKSVSPEQTGLPNIGVRRQRVHSRRIDIPRMKQLIAQIGKHRDGHSQN